MKKAIKLASLSFGKNKQQIRFTIGMLIVIVFIFSAVNFTIDSAEPTLANFAAKHGGSNDYFIHLKDQEFNSTASLFNFEEKKAQIYPSVNEIDFVFPRIITPILINDTQIEIFATDLIAERTKNIGYPVPKNKDEMDLIPQIINNGCIIHEYYAKYGWQEGDNLTFDFGFGFSLNFTLIKYVNILDGYPYGEYRFPVVLIDINTLWNKITDNQIQQGIQTAQANNFTGLCNVLVVGLKNSNNYYRTSDFEGSTAKLISVASAIKQNLGWEEWNIYYSKKSAFDASNQIFFATLIINIFTSLTAILFFAILIYNALTTSISEKVKEYGILQALGAKKKDVYQSLIIEGVLYGIIALGIGVPLSIIFSFLLSQTILTNAMQNLFAIDFVFVLLPVSVIRVILSILGIIGSFSLIPARIIYNFSIIQAIHPESLMEAESISNKKLKLKSTHFFISGLILTAIVLLIMSLIPTLFASFELISFVSFVVVLFFIGIIGLVILSVNFAPILLRFLVSVFGRWNKKIHEVLKLGINRHQRRNKTTTLILIFSFTILVFFLSFIRLLGDQIQSNTQCIYGSDLFIESRWNYPLNETELDDILQMEGIESACGLVHDLNNIAQSYNYLANSTTTPSLGFQIGDSAGLSQIVPALYAIDQNFYRTIFHDRILMKEGNFEQEYLNLFNLSAPAVFLSEQSAEILHITQNEYITLYFMRDGVTQTIKARVAGIYYTIPGAHYTYYSSFQISKVPEIVLSYELLATQLNVPKGDNAIYSRFLINFQDDANPEQMTQKIRDYYSNFDNSLHIRPYYQVYNSNHQFLQMAELIALILFSLLLMMVIAGFNISSYAIFLERRMETQIFRTLGLSNVDLRKLFFIELLIMLIANGLIGTIIGYLMAILFTNISVILFHSKGNVTFPFDLVGIVFAMCIILLLILYSRLFQKKMKYVMTDIQGIRRT